MAKKFRTDEIPAGKFTEDWGGEDRRFPGHGRGEEGGSHHLRCRWIEEAG